MTCKAQGFWHRLVIPSNLQLHNDRSYAIPPLKAPSSFPEQLVKNSIANCFFVLWVTGLRLHMGTCPDRVSHRYAFLPFFDSFLQDIVSGFSPLLANTNTVGIFTHILTHQERTNTKVRPVVQPVKLLEYVQKEVV